MPEDDSDLKQPVELPGDSQTTQPQSFSPPRQWGRIIKKTALRLGILLLILAAGFGAWKVIDSKTKNKPAATPAQTQPSSQPQQAAGSDVPDVDGTENFKSDSLLIELTHPTSWKAAEAADGVRIESPDFTYQTLNKGEVTGNFRIYIRKGARTQDSKYIGKGVAIKTSDQLTYSSPAAGQRTNTNLSAFGIDTPDNFAFFLIAGNFTLNKGDTLGPNYGKEADTYIIAGGYSAKDLTDDLATNSVSVDKYDKTKAYTQAIDILKSLKIK